MSKKRFLMLGLAAFLLAAFFSYARAQEKIPDFKLVKLSAPPVLDGDNSEWKPYAEFKIDIEGEVDANGQRVRMYGGVYGDSVYFCVTWRDYHADTEHVPYYWDGTEYRKDYKKMEDGFSIDFAFKGEYASCMLYGTVFETDIWYWKSVRTNPAGLALDGVMRFEGKEFPGSKPHSSFYGKPLYIGFIDDAGEPIYSQLTYHDHTRDRLPQFKIHQNASGSIADVKAVGKWKRTRWTLELSRKLNTGHPDDLVFEPGKSYQGAIAVYDAEEGRNHSVSRTINFVFPK